MLYVVDVAAVLLTDIVLIISLPVPVYNVVIVFAAGVTISCMFAIYAHISNKDDVLAVIVGLFLIAVL